MPIRLVTRTVATGEVENRNSILPHRQDFSFDHRRIQFYCGILLEIEIAFFLFAVCSSGLIIPKPGSTNSDFVSFYAAGKLAGTAKPQLAYDRSAHFAVEEQADPPLGYKFFYYPPVFLLLCSILGRLPYSVSFIVFEGLTLLLYLLIASHILGERGWSVLVPLLAFPEVFWALISGQNAFLTAGLFGAATLLVDKRPAISGLLFGALCYKPHFGLLVPIALAAGRRWRAFAAAFASAAGLCLLSLIAFGWNAWHAFLITVVTAPGLYESYSIWYSVTPFGAMRMLGASPAVAYAVQAAVTFAAAALIAYIWHWDRPLPLRAAVLVAATLVAVPAAFFYDLMLAAIAGAWLIRAESDGAMPRWEKAALAGLFLVPLGSRFLTGTLHAPIEPLAAMALFLLAAARACARRDMLGSRTGLASAGSL